MKEDCPASRMSRARAAQVKWARLSASQRVKALRPLRHAIAERMDEIVSVISHEIGKPAMDALAGDLMVSLEQFRYYERNAARILRRSKIAKPWFLYSGTRFAEIKEPHGVVLVFAPWNYPFQLAVIPLATALFAGNAVMLKCSEHAPRTAQLIADLCKSACLPEDLVQVSWEDPSMAALLLEARPDLVFFTGSSRKGLGVAARAAELLIPTVMELGGKDAALVFDSCDLERTANGLAYGCFSNAGQVCVGTKRIYAQQGIYEKFLQCFLESVSRLRLGTSVESDLGAVHFEMVRKRMHAQVDAAVASGAKMHTPWSNEEEVGAPFILTGVLPDAALLVEETFGPVVCIAPFVTEPDAIELANNSSFALSASVWTGNREQGDRVAMQLQSGSCAVNDVIRNIGNPEAAFGGNKSSGYGRYHGAAGLLTFSRVKTIMTTVSRRRTEMHWFPFKTRTYNRLRALLKMRHIGVLRNRLKAFKQIWAIMLILTSGLGWAQPISDAEGSLAIDVALPPHAHGQIAYMIFDAADGFPDNRIHAVNHDFVPVAQPDSPMQHIDLGPLPPGRYAVSVYLDENGNHKLDKNWMGIPMEAVGASNNPQARMGPPKFDECAFAHGRKSELISIKLVRCCRQ